MDKHVTTNEECKQVLTVSLGLRLLTKEEYQKFMEETINLFSLDPAINKIAREKSEYFTKKYGWTIEAIKEWWYNA